MSNDITLTSKESILDDEAATLACGARFAKVVQAGLVVYLHGDLGAGKTTFARGVLHGLGYVGKVKSPTYTLVESYPILFNNIFNYTFYHFDLYRFIDENEWEAAGFRDYFNPQSVCMIEWPEKAEHMLPIPDVNIQLSLLDLGTAMGRKITFSAASPLGVQCLTHF
jgi:tRNA threonylcarbamoyladenosine biosynthesis protein TsaE